MSRKPCCRKLRAADSRTCSNAASGTVMVPGKRMCAVGGSMLPSGTYDDDRRDERVAERLRDLRRERLDPDVVLAQHHVRTALLGAADRDDDRRLPGTDPSSCNSGHVSSSTNTVAAARAGPPASAVSRKRTPSHGEERIM